MTMKQALMPTNRTHKARMSTPPRPAPRILEELESRRLLSVSITSIGETTGVAPAASTSIALGPNTLFFNAVTKGNTDTLNSVNSASSGGSHTSTYQLRVTNTGTKRLLVSSIKIRGTDQGDFTINFPSGGQSFGVGKQINYDVKFTADSTVGLKSAFLAVASGAGTSRVPLSAMVTKGEGTTFEPSLQDIFNLYGFKINAGEQSNTANPYFVAASKTDEVNISTLVKANANAPVVVRPLAEFTNHATPDVRMGFYTPGDAGSEQYLWYSPSQSSQSVTPLVYGQTSFNPGSGAFGLVTQYPYFTNPNGTTENVYSENALNKRMYTTSNAASTSVVHMKFYPYKDSNGNTVANTYIVAEEEYNQDSVSDSQDLVFIVTNVKPAPDKATISIQNLTAYPSDDIATFNTLKNQDPDVGNILKTQNTIRVYNSGSEPLVATIGLTGTDAADYSIGSGGGSATIAAGAFRDVVVNFNATSGTDVHAADLTITSTDTATPTKNIALLGNWQEYSEQQGPGDPSLEPSAVKLVDQLLGYQTVLQNPGQTLAGSDGVGSTLSYPGEEITAEYFQAADTGAQVNITQLATFHNQTYVASDGTTTATSSFMGYYKQGSPDAVKNILFDNAKQGQEVLGPDKNRSGYVAHGKFTFSGTQIFGFSVEHQNSTDKPGEYSDHTLNVEAADQQDSNIFGGLFLRIFPAYSAEGVLIPNTYIMLHDYNKSTTNYDFQDNVYLISNITPAGAMKTPRTVYAQKTSAGNLINFTSPDDGPNVKGFNVYRTTTPNNPDSWTKLNTAGTLPRKASGSYTDTTAGSTQYYYAVTTVGAGGAESEKYEVALNG